MKYDKKNNFEIVHNEIMKSVKKYQKPILFSSIFQVASTIPSLILCYYLIYYGLKRDFFWSLLLTPIASGLSIRTFILQHDCGHGSLFKSRRVNDFIGWLCSLLTLTPYDHWKKHHSLHHASWNNLDTRGRISDFYSDCITVADYQKMTRLKKFFYRLSKKSFLTIFLMPPIIFFIVYRFAFDTPLHWVRERVGVYATNICLLGIYGTLSLYLGLKSVILVSFMVIYPASIIGVWLFLIQHKFENVQWSAHPEWNSYDAAVMGCSFLRLPQVMRWFTGDIGTHHIHHIAPGIPNYRLVSCHDAHPVFQGVKILNWRDGIREARTNVLWDEKTKTMVNLHSVR